MLRNRITLVLLFLSQFAFAQSSQQDDIAIIKTSRDASNTAIARHGGGNYSAMWRKIDGEWKLQAELFVSLKKL